MISVGLQRRLIGHSKADKQATAGEAHEVHVKPGWNASGIDVSELFCQLRDLVASTGEHLRQDRHLRRRRGGSGTLHVYEEIGLTELGERQVAHVQRLEQPFVRPFTTLDRLFSVGMQEAQASDLEQPLLHKPDLVTRCVLIVRHRFTRRIPFGCPAASPFSSANSADTF